MDRIDSMRLFVRFTELGSISRAAGTTGISQGAASKQLAHLERLLGAQLMLRSSHGVRLTEAGRDYYAVVRGVLDELDRVHARIADHQVVPTGRLRLSMPGPFGRRHIVPHLGEFLALHPGLQVDADVSARHVSLAAEGFDLAIRIGRLADSSLVARCIGRSERVTVASPAYLARHGGPSHPEDVAGMPCVVAGQADAPAAWPYIVGGQPITVAPQARVRVNDCEHARAAVLQGLGLGHAARWLFDEDLRTGQLVEVLAPFAPPSVPISALMVAGRRAPSKVTVFTAFLADKFKAHPALAPGRPRVTEFARAPGVS